jgi:gliding motility-associated-like protein
MDLLNGPLKCDAVLAHYDAVVDLFRKEMLYHEDPASTPGGTFTTLKDDWDTNTAKLRRFVSERCTFMQNALATSGCYLLGSQHYITVDVYPPDAGKVRLNTEVLPKYIWNGAFYQTELAFKAIPTNTTYVFHHWEFAHHAIKNHAPLSLDSVAIDFNQDDQIIAFFTDVTADIVMPTGFSPNGDGNNDYFQPAGSALYVTDFDFRIWNRWGQEVFRSTDAMTGWNGYYEDRICQTGVYAYVITYKNKFNEFKTLKGNVTLMK